MGKKNKKNKSINVENLISDEALRSLSKKEVTALKANLDKISKEVRIGCSHTKKNGEPTLTVIDQDRQLVECDKCGVRFSLALISGKELNHATRTIHNAVNQIKLLTDGDKADQKAITDLGLIPENNDGVNALYNRTLLASGKGKKNKKKNKNNSYGGYGYGAIKFNK